MDDDVIIERDGREEDGASEEDIEATEARADTKVSKVKKDLDTCKKEKQEYLDGWQRAKADYVNALKRFEEEKKGAMDRGSLKAASAFLPAIDSLERAEGAGGVPEGFQGIAKQLHEAVTSLGLVRFGQSGEPFDPMHHEALGQDETPDLTLDDTVSAVLEQGWKLHDTIVRPAKVRVAQFAA
ncbi:MAG: nucleotide exchange factor GrpE [Patescibacteria group bacterium]